MDWTDERTERATALWRSGHSAAQIAADLGGVSRNAVHGKLYRLGLTPRGPVKDMRPIERTSARPARKARHRPHTEFRRPPPADRPAPPPSQEFRMPAARVDLPLELTLFELTDATCRFPVTEAPPHLFCGHPVKPGEVYCPKHCAICYSLGTRTAAA